ncbi:vitamin B12-dependent ribonucleotide reductase [Candidatus Uhrbacteria bacterium]|nr:vitamin B12-dependent ribonucleotide reductase [Candidatus Uhrbacteria bacterium]
MPNAPTLTQAPQTSDVSKAVWDYVTSLKAVKKRDGTEEMFSGEKLERSLGKAFAEAGIKEGAAVEVAGWVISRLVHTYDGHTVPTTADIREVVLATLIDRNLIHVAKKYAGMRQRLLAAKSIVDVYGNGLTFERYFTKEGVHPYDMITWVKRDAVITDHKGNVVFEQKEVEVPDFWTQTAINIVVSKYFRGKVGAPERENSARQLISRVADTMAGWGRSGGYFQTARDADIFQAELTYILINQMAAFNSPVWFNVGIAPQPQCSACFINSVQDDMRSILGLAMTEGMLFKGGSGTGSNLSKLRSSKEYLNGSNGKSSGPVSFMKGLDAFAGVIKSGGKTRRAAKMVILNVDHPDIEEFIECKAKEEKKAWALVDAGYDASLDGDAYGSIFFQNANNSVRVTDEFMQAAESGGEWVTHEVTTGKPSVRYGARELLRKMAQAAWDCGDPGVQYDTTVNAWHTSKNTDRINASNPCSEYMFLDDTACNLASLNLMKFRKEVDGIMEFDAEAFKKANEVIITAMEIAVGFSSYPTPAIEQNSFDYRPLGIGYANLGALLMSRGLAYDSDEGRNFAAAITSLQSGHCYFQSAKIAEKIGPFAGYKKNEEPALGVMKMHRAAAYKLSCNGVPNVMCEEAKKAWDHVVEHATKFGLRNAQISVIAPTGTIAFLMDCDTTGIEPDIALVKYKWLVGGGMMKMVNKTVPEALAWLGYSKKESDEILAYIDTNDTIEGAPHMKEEHLSVFDCAFKPAKGTRSINYMGHVHMMAAVQPFISGAISKTVNMPSDTTVEDIEHVYKEGWRLGLKAIAIYRDGCKRQQPLTTSADADQEKKRRETQVETKVVEVNVPRRRRLPDERKSLTHKFSVAGHEGYITVGLYDDGTPGEIFVTMSKQGSTMRGLMDSFSTAVSIGLQYGVPLAVLSRKFVHMRFEPSGFTTHPEIRMAKSILDYLFRWLALKFLKPEEARDLGVHVIETNGATEIEPTEAPVVLEPAREEGKAQPTLFAKPQAGTETLTATFSNSEDAPACGTCGAIMVRNAACYKCLNCGSTSGCS